jgi:hypothetical protein
MSGRGYGKPTRDFVPVEEYFPDEELVVVKKEDKPSVLESSITVSGWESIKSAFINKDTFEHEIWGMCASEEPCDTKIVLPPSLTKSERESISLLTRSGFKTDTFSYGKDRFMVLYISKKYIELLNDTFKK